MLYLLQKYTSVLVFKIIRMLLDVIKLKRWQSICRNLNMKNLLCFLFAVFVIASCNDSNEDASTIDPSETHPPSEALPDTMQLVNDSVIVPDNAPDTGVRAKVGANDSIQ
jgi:hypothetical protein